MENQEELKEIESLEELEGACDEYTTIRRTYRFQIFGALGLLGVNVGLKVMTVHLFAQRGMPNGHEIVVGLALHGTVFMAQLVCVFEAIRIRPRVKELLSNIQQYKDKNPTLDVETRLSDRSISV